MTLRGAPRVLAALAWLGAGYALATDLSPELRYGTPSLGPAPAHQTNPLVATDGTNGLVVWTDFRKSPFVTDERGQDQRAAWDGDVYGARVSASGALLDPTGFPIAIGPRMQRPAGIIFDGTNYVVAYIEETPVIARVTPQGQVLDPAGLQVGRGERADDYGLAMAFDGRDTVLLAWIHSFMLNPTTPRWEIQAIRVKTSGALVDPEPFVLVPAYASVHDYWGNRLSVAFDGTNFMAAWSSLQGNNSTVRVARVGLTGGPLDGAGVVVASAIPGRIAQPSIAFGASTYLVAWTESGTNDNVRAALVPTTATGISAPLGVSVASHDTSQAVVSFIAPDFHVAWTDWRAAVASLYVGRVTEAGVVRDTDGFLFLSGASDRTDPFIATSGSPRLVVWNEWRTEDRDVYAARLSGTQSLDADGVLLSASADRQEWPVTAFDGARTLMVWEARDATGLRLLGAFVETGRAPGTPFVITAEPNRNAAPAVAFDGTNYLVVWERDDDLVGARVTKTGTLLDATPFDVCDATEGQTRPALTWDGTQYLVAWEDGRDPALQELDLYAARISPAGTVSPPNGFALRATAEDERGVKLSTNQAGVTLAVWDEGRTLPSGGGVQDVRAARLAGATTLDSTPFLLRADSYSTNRLAVASDGAGWLVAYEHTRAVGDPDLWVTRVSAQGAVQDPDGVNVSDAPDEQTNPALAFDGERYLLVWEDARSWMRDLYGTWITPDGRVPNRDPMLLSAEKDAHELRPSVRSYGSGRFLVSYARLDSSPEFRSARMRSRWLSALPARATCATDGECESNVCAAGLCSTASTGNARFNSVPESLVTCTKTLRYSEAGPTVSGQGPFRFFARMVDGSELPEGLSVDEATGQLSWTPRREQVGRYFVELVAEGQGAVAVQVLNLSVECAPLFTKVSCAGTPEAASPLSWLVALGLSAGRRAWRRRATAAAPRGEPPSGQSSN